jgi:hypothetical protein
MIGGLICVLLFSSCRRDVKTAATLPGPPQIGATYCLNDGEGGFRAAKVLVVEEEVVFVRLFAERWSARPSLSEVRKTRKSASVAYSSETFTGMQPTHLENGGVSADDLEAYESWKATKREIF